MESAGKAARTSATYSTTTLERGSREAGASGRQAGRDAAEETICAVVRVGGLSAAEVGAAKSDDGAGGGRVEEEKRAGVGQARRDAHSE